MSETVGQTLLSLKDRADLTLDQIATGAGYKGRSSIQEYFKPTYEGPLGAKAAVALAEALKGKGTPPIGREEIINLAGAIPAQNARPFNFEGSSLEELNRDMPVYGTALGAERVIDGEAIEQTTLNRAEVLEYRPRPVAMNGKQKVYGLYVQGSSMDLVYDDGELIVAQRDAPVSPGDFVVVYMRPKDDTDDGERATAVLVKRLVRRTSQYYELQQFSPMLTFKIASCDVLRIDRILRIRDILN